MKPDAATELRSPRTLMRPWRDSDREPFAALNADPEVMRFLPGPIGRADSDAMLDRLQASLEEHGYGFWALEIPGKAECAGFVGLKPITFPAPFPSTQQPVVEIGWRLARPFWSGGYATEAAATALRYGFETVGLQEIVAYTVPENSRSQAVMTRLGMVRDTAGDFDHPLVPPEFEHLRRSVLYRLGRAQRKELTRPAAPPYGIDHIQLAMPPGGEPAARQFFVGVLGFTEVPKPAELAKNGGAWFSAPGVMVHVGAEPGFRPSSKAHPAFLVRDLDNLCTRIRRCGYPVDPVKPLGSVRRTFTRDPFGNRIELVEPA